MQEITTIPQHAAGFHDRLPGDLLHPTLIGMNGDPAISTRRHSRWMKNNTS
jgi:hypothetical protein